MMDAMSSVRCFHEMQALTRKHGRFTSNDLIKAGFKDFHVRSYLIFCRARKAIERLFNEPQDTGATCQTFRVIDVFPPMLLTPNDDKAALSALVVAGLARSSRDREGLDRCKRLWTGLRGLRQTTPAELAFAASLEDRPVTSRQALLYLIDLASAGYVARLDDQFRLLPGANSGPHPVAILSGRILDLNLMRTVNVTASQIGRVA
ncbi:MAG: hypothetical protein ACRDBL_09225 [Rhabdaerophilum sp.]